MNILLLDKNLILKVNHLKWLNFLEDSGFSMDCVTPSFWYESEREVHFDKSLSYELNITSLDVLSPGYENRAFYKSGIEEMFTRKKYDAIICFEEPFSLFAAQATYLRNKYQPNAKLFFFSWYNLLPDKIGGYSYPFIYNSILKYVLKYASEIWCANDVAELFYGRKGVRTQKIYFGVDITKHTKHVREPYQYSETPFLFGYVGRLLKMKGIDILIHAFCKLQESQNVRLLILGSGPEEESLNNMVSDLGIEDKVSFTKSVPPEQVLNIMASLDALVLPSKTTSTWAEQYGRVLVEAMACGVPVLGSDSGAIPEVVGDAGIIFKEQNVEDLVFAMNKISTDGDLWNTCYSKGLVRARKFSSPGFAAAVLDRLNEYIG